MGDSNYNISIQSLSDDVLLSDAKVVFPSKVNFSHSDISSLSKVGSNGDEVSESIIKHTNGNSEESSASESNLNAATIIEHAFNVMKNLFSPDKGKSKPIVTPYSQRSQENSSENPSSCDFVINKPEDVIEPSTVSNSEASETNSLKYEMSQVMPSVIVQDVLNNTDDSFLTTVSFIDESFQSAITHLDENGDRLKISSPNLVEDVSDNSFCQTGLCNETLDGNDYSLEKTLLKDRTVEIEDSDFGIESNASREEDLETLNSTQIINLDGKNDVENVEEVVDMASFEDGQTRANEKNELGNFGKDSVVEIENKFDNVSKIAEVDGKEESISNDSQLGKTSLNVEMENLFLNKRFENTPNEAECSKPDSPKKDGNIEGNPRGDTAEIKGEISRRIETDDPSKVSLGEDRMKTNIHVVENDAEIMVDISFSTTTVVLAESDDNERLCLSEDDCKSHVSGASPKHTGPDFIKNKPPQVLYSSPHKIQKCKNGSETKKPILIIKPTAKKVSKSEGNSPNKSPKTKRRLNKSLDVLSPSQSRESPRKKCEKESLIGKGKDGIFRITDLNFNSNNDNSSRNTDREQLSSTSEVLSQESYTILNAPESLERPVIKSSKEHLHEEVGVRRDVMIDRPRQSTPISDGTTSPKSGVAEKPGAKGPLVFTTPRVSHSPGGKNVTFRIDPEPTELSPVASFDSSTERIGNGSGLNSTWVLPSKQSNELNRTYDKKQESVNSLSQTDCVAMNETYEKEKIQLKTEEASGGTDQTFDKDQSPFVLVSVKACLVSNSSEDPNNFLVNVTNERDESKGANGRDCSPSDSSTVFSSESNNHVNDLDGKFNAMSLNDASSLNGPVLEDKLDSSFKSQCDPDLVQLIQEQFSSTDIEKICSVVDDMSSVKLSNDILKASEQFDKSFHESLGEGRTPGAETKSSSKPIVNSLSPHSFDFLNSIKGKPTGRDLSRESLYVKFDPLVQAPNANSLIDFTKEPEFLPTIKGSPESEKADDVCEQLLAISPQKKPDYIVPPLTPLSHKSKMNAEEDKFEKLRELQNEIFFLKNLYAEREKMNKGRMEDYESRVAKLTGENCILEERLRDSSEREKSLVRKLNEQSRALEKLKTIMEEYIKVIARLTEEIETMRLENAKQIESLTAERDSFVVHLQNTEAAFTDVHAKYEKSKKAIWNLKANEAVYKATLAEQAAKLEEFKERAKEAQEKAAKEFHNVKMEMEEMKGNHVQETTRLRAQLRKNELKLEAMQESLDQKIKENEQLTAICDELIEGRN